MVQCLKCGYEWKQRGKERPKSCPECKSRRWDGIGWSTIVPVESLKKKKK